MRIANPPSRMLRSLRTVLTTSAFAAALASAPAAALQNYLANPNFDEIGPRGPVTDDAEDRGEESFQTAAANWGRTTLQWPNTSVQTELVPSNFVAHGSALHMTINSNFVGVYTRPTSSPAGRSVFLCAWLKATQSNAIIVQQENAAVLAAAATGDWQEIHVTLPATSGAQAIIVGGPESQHRTTLDIDTIVETDSPVPGSCPHQWQGATTAPHMALFPKHPYPKIENGSTAIQDDSRPAIGLPPSIHLPDFIKHTKPLPNTAKNKGQ